WIATIVEVRIDFSSSIINTRIFAHSFQHSSRLNNGGVADQLSKRTRQPISLSERTPVIAICMTIRGKVAECKRDGEFRFADWMKSDSAIRRSPVQARGGRGTLSDPLMAPMR